MAEHHASHITHHVLMLCVLPLVLAACAAATPQTTMPAPSIPAITISAPPPDAAIASSFELRGQVAGDTAAGGLAYRVFDHDGRLAGSGSVPLDAGGAFAAPVAYASDVGGPGRVEVVALRADDTPFAIGAVMVRLTAVAPPDAGAAAMPAPAPTAAPLHTAVPASNAPEAAQQTLVIDSPAPGTLVGSPIVLTGHASVMPAHGALGYRVLDASGQQRGSGSLALAPAAEGGGAFTASLLFDLPPSGGTIRVELFEQHTDSIVASTSQLLMVAGPQRIVIDSPAPGTLVGSPMVLTGFTTQMPCADSLAYRVLDAAGQQLGAGRFAVQGMPGQPGRFSASLPFDLPPDGGAIAVELRDQNPDNGAVAASAVISLQVAAPRQVIVIDSPAPGAQVGSPVVLTGRAALVPASGQLRYCVRDASGGMLGSGTLPVRNAGPVAVFTASLTFAEPSGGGPITIELREEGEDGTLVARSSIDLVVAGR